MHYLYINLPIVTGRQIEKSKGLDPVENLRQITLLKWALISSAEYRNPDSLTYRYISNVRSSSPQCTYNNKTLLEQDRPKFQRRKQLDVTGKIKNYNNSTSNSHVRHLQYTFFFFCTRYLLRHSWRLLLVADSYLSKHVGCCKWLEDFSQQIVLYIWDGISRRHWSIGSLFLPVIKQSPWLQWENHPTAAWSSLPSSTVQQGRSAEWNSRYWGPSPHNFTHCDHM